MIVLATVPPVEKEIARIVPAQAASVHAVTAK